VAHTVVMPKLGNTVESCVINTWLVEVGQQVEATTALCEVETDKSSVEVPAGIDGTVLALLAEVGDEVAVLAPVAVVGAPGEAVDPALLPSAPADAAPSQVDAPAAPATTDTPETTVPLATDTPETTVPADESRAFSPRAANLARDKGVPKTAVPAGSGPHGRVIARDVEEAAAAGPGLTRAAAASPDAENYQPGATGSGIGGRVVAADLTAAPSAAGLTAAPSAAPIAPESTDTQLKGIRKLIAERMVASLATTAQVSYQTSAPATGLLALRARLKGTDPELGLTGVTIGDLVAFAAARVAAKHPVINAHLADGVLRTFATVHLGLAVDTPRGLMVPTVAEASAISLKALSATTKDLAAQCQAGSISPDLLAGATFTVTNLGSFGIEAFTPIVNVPQTSILGVSAITDHPVEKPDGGVGIEKRIGFSLTADHRVVDGADAARYLRDLVSAIAEIDVTVLS